MKFSIRFQLSLVLLSCACLRADDGILHLAIGDADSRNREVPLVLDALTDSRTGELLTPGELPERLTGVDLLLIGESHTDIDSHRVQLRVVSELHRAGRRVMIGLEMFPYTHQQHLDNWVAGYTTESGFLELADWYGNWGYHWGYYRDLFLLARDLGLPMFAINTPREVVTAVREKGFQDLTEEEAEHIPSEIDTENADHLRLFKAYFDEDDPIHAQMSEEAWQSMLRAQCTWDATMGFNAVRAFDRHADEDGILVVLAGSGHVAYGLGIERQSAQWFDGEIATLIPVSVVDADGEAVSSVRGSYADFLWGLPKMAAPIYPSLGLSTRKTDDGGRKVIHVAEDSSAEGAGFQVGDLLLTVEGEEITSGSTLSRLMAEKRWGDALSATVQRDGTPLKLEVLLRRTVEDSDDGSEGDDSEGDKAEDDEAEDDEAEHQGERQEEEFVADTEA